MSERELHGPDLTDDEEARIQRGIAADPDNPELTAEDFARAIPASAFFTPGQLADLVAKRGRGPGRRPAKLAIKLRLDPDVVAVKAEREGW